MYLHSVAECGFFILLSDFNLFKIKYFIQIIQLQCLVWPAATATYTIGLNLQEYKLLISFK